MDGTSIWKLKISCHFLHSVKTENIWLKSALKVERDILLTSGRSLRDETARRKCLTKGTGSGNLRRGIDEYWEKFERKERKGDINKGVTK